jgi:DNA (cytosine-5)-methyltransferase 1
VWAVLTVGSLFAGVGGFDLGLERAGMRTVWMVENDKQCQQVLRHHWPEVEVYGDVREVAGIPLDEPTPHGIGPRGSGTDAQGGDRPGNSVNSGGGLDTGGEDAGRTQLVPVDVLCGGFPCQDYSVAGKREGLVGDRGALWWEFHRLIADLRPTWVVGENVPGLLSSGGGRDFRAIVGSLVQLGYGVTWAVLDSQYFGVAQRRRRLFFVGHSGGVAKPEVLALAEGLYRDAAPSREAGKDVSGSIGGRAAGEGGHRLDLDNHGAYPLAHSLTGRYDSSEDGTGRGTPIVVSETGSGWWSDGVSPLRADPGGMPSHVVAFDTTQVTHKANRSNPKPGDPCHPLAAGAHAPAVAFNVDRRRAPTTDEISNSLHSSPSGTMFSGVCAPAVANYVPMKYRGDPHEGTDTIVGAIPRRLTPTECERLQGFPDGWTAVDGMKDGPRYRMMGNAVTVPVVEYIGRRILEAERSGM